MPAIVHARGSHYWVIPYYGIKILHKNNYLQFNPLYDTT